MAAAVLKDKIPPHNEEAEQAALGALLLDEDAITVVIQYLRADDFYSNANRRVYEAVLNLFNQGRKADIITVTEALRQAGTLDTSGGAAYVASLTNVVPSSANVDYYAQIVKDCSTRRALLRISAEATAQSFDESRESRVILEETQQRLFDLSDNRQTLTFKNTQEIIPKAIDRIQTLFNNKDAYTGIPSGLEKLDDMTSGFQNSELIIIGARPSMGKTALALTMAANMSIHNKKRKIPIAFFSLEMSDIALVMRLVSSEARIESTKIRAGLLKSSDFDLIYKAADRIYNAPFYIGETPNMKLMDLRAQARRARIQYKVEIIFIDYIGLISSDNNLIPRYEQVAQVSRSLKSLARELDIPIVALSQVRRDAEGKRPNLSDIRESGSIEQDADLVMFLNTAEDTDKKFAKELPSDGMLMELNVAKQRNGPTGPVKLVFLKKYTRFESWEKEG
jgi:replicative DNA helicase